MEHSASAIGTPLPEKQSDPPGWTWLAASLVICAIVSYLALAVMLQLSQLGRLLPSNLSYDDNTFGWPWPVTDAWSLLANVGQALLVGFALAGTLRLAVQRLWRDWELRAWPIAIAWAIGAPASSTLAASALIVVVARTIALRPAVTPRPRPRRVVVLALAFGAMVLTVASLSYQPLHPLLATFSDRQNPLVSTDLGPEFPESPQSLGFAVRNDGVAAVQIRSMRAVGWETSVVVVERSERSPTGGSLARHGELAGTIRLASGFCQTPAAGLRQPAATVTALEVRYKALGAERVQRLKVSPSENLFCP